jgi:hypothetical protein
LHDKIKEAGERAINSVTGAIEDQFTQFRDEARHKVAFNYDLRSPSFDIGVLEVRGGGRLRVTSDGCCVKVSGGPTVWIEGKTGRAGVSLVGGVTVTARGTWPYCWTEGGEELGGEWGGTGRLGLRIGVEAGVVKAYGEGGAYVSYRKQFGETAGEWGVGVYARAVFAVGIGKWERRREYNYTWGDPAVGF